MRVCPQCAAEYPEDVDFCPRDGMKLRAQRLETEDPLLGRVLDGRWVIEEKLGEGGMGAVYKGHQQSVSRTVAIKTLRPQLVESEEFVDRFFREAKIAAAISHPHCVTILDYGESEDGTLYLAMEFLEGELLTDRLEGGTLTVKQVVEVGIQVASALSAAHEQSIVHRDLKPDNIFLLEVPGGGTFSKVLDFGIAKMLDSNTQVTKTGMIFGTPEYMSPEQCKGGQLDGRSDLYSLGCILYELVGGSTPFRATTPMAVLMAHVNEDVTPLRTAPVQAHIPDSLDHVIMKLLEKLPERRYQSATELREALEQVLANLDNPSAQVSGSHETVAPPVQIGFDNTMALSDGSVEARSPDNTTAPHLEDYSGDTSKTRLFAIAAVLLVAVVAVGALAAVAMKTSELGDASAEPPVTTEETEPDEKSLAAIEPPDEAGETDEVADVVAEETAEPTEEVAEERVDEVAKAEPKPRARKSGAAKTAPAEEESLDDESLDEIAAEMKKAQEAEEETPEPTAEPEPKKKEPETNPRQKKRRDRVRKINKKAEEIKKKALDNVLDGLMGE